jgi:hypothetical protein
MFQTQAMIGRRTVLAGIFGSMAGMALVACGGKSNDASSTAAPAAASASAVSSGAAATAAPTLLAKSNSKAPLARTLLSKEEAEAVLGMPLRDPKEVETYDGNHVSYYPIGVTVERGGNMAYDLNGFRDTFSMTDPVPEFGNEAFSSMTGSDVVVLRNGTLVYIGTAGVKQDGITLDMLKTLMQKALSRL